MNKKLIKTITCVACGLGIASSIPFMTTSCGSEESWPKNALPKDVYNIDKDGVLSGWADGLDKDKIAKDYPNCDTMLIPNNVKTIKQSAFGDLKIPNTIKVLDLTSASKLTTIQTRAFDYANNSSLTTLKIPKSVSTIEFYAFNGDEISNLYWDFDHSASNYNAAAFNSLPYVGVVYSLSKPYTSSKFLEWLKLQKFQNISDSSHPYTFDTWTAATDD